MAAKKIKHPLPEVGTVSEAIKSDRQGWIIGHFMPKSSMAHTHELEVRVWDYPPNFNYGVKAFHGEELIIVYVGHLRITLGEKRSTTVHEVPAGEYIIVPPGVKKNVLPLQYSAGVTVRWPSLPGSNKVIAAPR